MMTHRFRSVDRFTRLDAGTTLYHVRLMVEPDPARFGLDGADPAAITCSAKKLYLN
jgi:hypothetical protein